jgi:spore maturation protein CgeB
MKILFLDTIYPSILEDKGFFDLPEKGDSYKDLARTLDDQKFSSGSMYLPGLVALSNQIEVVYVNARKLQLLWDGPLDSGRCSPKYSWKYWQLISRIPLLGNLLHDRSKKARIVMNQIKILAPSVVYCLNVNFLSERLIKQIKEMGVAVVGQIASPLPPLSFYKSYDHIFSAHPGQVEHFRKAGVSSSWLPLAFDNAQRKSFDQTGWPERTRDVTFVGTFGRHQRNTGPLLKAISKEIPTLQIFTLSKLRQLKRFGLLNFFKGRAWGPEMYKILAESKIVINRHGPVADGYSVNFRMFEATGMGALLVTEQGKNTSDLFEPGKEVLTYTSVSDAVQVLKSALADFDTYGLVAAAGQERTLTKHTYEQRATEIDQVLRKLVDTSAHPSNSGQDGQSGASR